MTFRIGGKVVIEPSRSQLESMRPGDVIDLAPCASKPDQFGERHCAFPSIVPYDPSPASAFQSLIAIELESPCTGADRAHVPLFARADGSPFGYHELHALLRSIVLHRTEL